MKLISFLSPYLLALILTLIIEGALCLRIKRNKDWLKFTCLVNLFTNPLLNALYTILSDVFVKFELTTYIPLLLIFLEFLVWLSEAWLFYRFALTQDSKQNKPVSSIYSALAFSFVLNAVSFVIGLLLLLLLIIFIQGGFLL